MTSILIAGDSSFIRLVIRKRLAAHGDVHVVGDSPNNASAITMIRDFCPDIVLVDIDVPTPTSLLSIQNILQEIPTCTIIVLMNLSIGGAELALKALEYGAVDFIHKESSIVDIDMHAFDMALVAKIKQWSMPSVLRSSHATGSNSNGIKKNLSSSSLSLSQSSSSPAGAQGTGSTPVFSPLIDINKKVPPKKPRRAIDLVMIGISTGGPLTLLKVLNKVKKLRCPLIIAQHMPQAFTKSLSIHLRNETNLNVVEGTHALPLEPGMVVIARGGTDSRVQVVNQNRLMLIEKVDPMQIIHPSVDVLFQSVAQLSCETLSIIMTGMGCDGLEGVKRLYAKQQTIIAQDPETCIVSGMPSAIIDANLASYILAPEFIGELISNWCEDEKS